MRQYPHNVYKTWFRYYRTTILPGEDPYGDFRVTTTGIDRARLAVDMDMAERGIHE